MNDVGLGLRFIFSVLIASFSSTICWKTFPFLKSILLCQKSNYFACIELSILFHWPICLSNTVTFFVVSLKVRNIDLPTLLIFFWNSFGYCRSFAFPCTSKNQLANFYFKTWWGYDDNFIESIDEFREVWHLNNIASFNLRTWHVHLFRPLKFSYVL